jgi:hypothetical protein
VAAKPGESLFEIMANRLTAGAVFASALFANEQL